MERRFVTAGRAKRQKTRTLCGKPFGAHTPDTPVCITSTDEWLNGVTNTHGRTVVTRPHTHMPQVRLVELPNANRLSNIEQPETFTNALLNFLGEKRSVGF